MIQKLVIIASFGAIFLKGFVLSKLWGWFLVPLGVPEIGFAHSIGVCILISFLTFQNIKSYVDDNKTAEQRAGEYIGWIILYPLLTLLFGFLASLFI